MTIGIPIGQMQGILHNPEDEQMVLTRLTDFDTTDKFE